jgi:predicted AlkP superfamily phosphohydrolase/phosphomutase
MRAIIFGVDGLSYRILHPLIERGDLPNFARLQREGVEADFISTVTPMTPPAWMSLVTGLKPAKHGVFDFTEFDLTSSKLTSRMVTHRKGGKAIWNILSEFGKRVVVMNVPVTYPPDTVNGIMVSGLMTPGASSSFTYPGAFKDELYKAVPGYRIDLSVEKTAPDYFVDSVLDMTEKRIQLQEHLLSEHEWDFAFVCYVGPDRVQHRVWDTIATLSHEATTYYRLLDDALGRALNHLGPEDVLFVASDHGFIGAKKWFYINEYLRQRKLLQTSSASETTRAQLVGFGREAARKVGLLPLARKARKTYQHFYPKPPMEMKKSIFQPYFSDLNWDKTRACVLSSMAFSGGNADIFMSPGTTPEEMEELRLALAAEKDPRTGEPLAEAVYASDVLGIGPFRPEEEHLILLPTRGTTFHLGIGRTNVWETLEESKGVHEKEGVFYAWGSGIRQGVRLDPLQIYDLVPTVLQSLGISADEPFDGRVVREMFAGEQGAEESGAGQSIVAKKLRQLRAGKVAAQ